MNTGVIDLVRIGKLIQFLAMLLADLLIKFIDRQLFIDLLSRRIARIGAEKYLYISMGGRHLVDHRIIYRQLGIPNLFSFDDDGKIIERQRFNKPNGRAICEEMSSGSLAGRIDEL